MTAGRIANRFDLGGANYTVDAACGSSLAALNLAVRELRMNAADMVVLGGVDTVQNPFTYLAFSKTQAFSPRGRCRPFDAGADGIVISEGVGAVILKRLADAERDGDRIYAVIRGVGSSSDGRSRGLTAPGFEGQVRALSRAYSEAGIDPSTVDYIEAHGTGTAVGDVVELDALTRLLQAAGARPRQCVVGSVKSQIGHTKCAAGLAGLIHATLALFHRVHPPTIGITAPNPQFNLQDGPLRLNVKAQPWLHTAADRPRRAGVSAFGFGGTNFHAVLESYEKDPVAAPRRPTRAWPAELFAWSANDRDVLLGDLDRLAGQLAAGARPPLCDLAHSLAAGLKSAGSGPSLAIVAGSHEDLLTKLNLARETVRSAQAELNDPRGVTYAKQPSFRGQKVAFLFPGQGSQAVGMLGELAVVFDDVRRAYEEFDAAIVEAGGQPIGPTVFPPPAFDDQERTRQEAALRATEVAQPAIGAASVGLLRLLLSLGLEPAMAAGHSYGELTALFAAGALDTRGLAELSLSRGRLLKEAGGDHPGAMAALMTGPEIASELIADLPRVRIVNLNGPLQTVVAGPADSLEAALNAVRARQVRGRLLPVSCAFHTPLLMPAREPLAEWAARKLVRAARVSRLFQPRRRRPSGRSPVDRQPAGRTCDMPGAVRRDDFGHVRSRRRGSSWKWAPEGCSARWSARFSVRSLIWPWHARAPAGPAWSGSCMPWHASSPPARRCGSMFFPGADQRDSSSLMRFVPATARRNRALRHGWSTAAGPGPWPRRNRGGWANAPPSTHRLRESTGPSQPLRST